MARGGDATGREPGGGRSDRLDAGLRAAFGAADSVTGKAAETPSVVEALGFGSTQVMLESPAGEHTPLVQPISPELRDVERLVGRYQVVGEIAQGGVGVILKARDRDLGRDCAMKLLRMDLLKNPTIVQRFVEEAQVGAQLQHPGIVPVYELGLLADSRPYFTMKLVKGETLAILLSNRKSPKEDLRRFLGIFERICQTISYAHARDVVHRDLKPWNIMVGDYGDVKVMDWGFAKVRPPAGRGKFPDSISQSQISIIETIRSLTSSEQSLSGTVIGTPGYMPPEQAMGEIDRLDERADIFALGAILTEILTGSPAYTGDRVDEILFKASRARLDDARERLDKCGADKRLVNLAKQCMAPARKARPRDAGEVARVVTDYLSSVEADAQRSLLTAVQQKERARGERRARRLTISIAVAVTCAVLVAGGLFLLLTRNHRNTRLMNNRRMASLIEDASTLRRAVEAEPAGGVDRWSRPEAATEVALRFAGTSIVDDALREQARGLLEEIRRTAGREREAIAAGKRTEEMSRRLADIRTAGWESPGVPAASGAYPAAFREYGVDIEKLSSPTAAALLEDNPIRKEIIAALDDWSRDIRDRGPFPEPDNRPLQVLRILDPDATRDRIRFINAGKAPRARRPQLMTIARDMRPEERTGATAALLGESLVVAGSPETAVAPLRAALAKDPTQARAHFALGWALLNLRPPQPADARRHFTAVIARRPHCRGARLGLLAAFAAAGRSAAAEEIIADLLRESPGGQRIVAHRGRMQLTAGSTPVGLKTLAAASVASPDDPWIRTVHADALLVSGNPAAALRELSAARSLAPDYRPAQESWIAALDRTGNLSRAVDHYRALAKADRRAAEARYHLGTALTLTGQGEEAITALTEAVGLDPGEPDYWFALGRARFGTGDYEGAAGDFAEALTYRPGFPAARRYRAAALARRRETQDSAFDELRAAVAERPDDTDILADLAIVHLRQRDLPAALDYSADAVKASAKSPRSRYVRAMVLGAAGQFDRAQEAFGMAVAGAPENLRYLSGFGDFLRGTGRLAAEYRERKVQARIRPRDAVLRATVGCLDLEAGRLEDALGHLDAAIALRPDLAIAHPLRGRVLRRLGRDKEWLAACRAARDGRPDAPATWFHLGVALLQHGSFAEAYRCLVRAHATGGADPLWECPSDEHLREAKRMLELSENYEDALRGKVAADEPRELLLLARLCRRKANPELAFRFYLDAWERGGRQFPGEIYAIAGHAAACAGGLPKPERIARAHIALLWLEQGIQSLREHARHCVHGCAPRLLDWWVHEPRLAPYREGLSLDELPEEQADAFRGLWRRVRTMLARSRGQGREDR